jgi:hypothetical protein
VPVDLRIAKDDDYDWLPDNGMARKPCDWKRPLDRRESVTPLSSDCLRTAAFVGALIVLTSAAAPARETAPAGLLNVGVEQYVASVYDSPAAGRIRFVFYQGETTPHS